MHSPTGICLRMASDGLTEVERTGSHMFRGLTPPLRPKISLQPRPHRFPICISSMTSAGPVCERVHARCYAGLRIGTFAVSADAKANHGRCRTVCLLRPYPFQSDAISCMRAVSETLCPDPGTRMEDKLGSAAMGPPRKTGDPQGRECSHLGYAYV